MQNIAVQLAIQGFYGPRALDCMDVDDVNISLKEIPSTTWKPILKTAVERATLEGRAKRKRNMETLATPQNIVAAGSVQLPKNAGALHQLWDDLDNSLANVGVTDITLRKPSAVIEQCAAAVRKGLLVSLLSKGAVLTLLESRMGLTRFHIQWSEIVDCVCNNGPRICSGSLPTTNLCGACHDVAAMLQVSRNSAELCGPPQMIFLDLRAILVESVFGIRTVLDECLHV